MVEKESAAGARWDKRYAATQEPLFGSAPNEYLRMVCARSDFTARRVLALADGDGRNGVWLAEQGYDVTALDVSPVATARAESLDRSRGVTVARLVADLAVWQPTEGEAWDAVFLLYLQGARALRQRALKVAAAALAPGGWLVVEGFSKAQGPRSGIGPEDPELLYDLEEITDAVPDLQVIEALAGRVWLDEGPRHRGEVEVVRFAARRPA